MGSAIAPSEITPVTFDNGRTAFTATPALRIGQLRSDRIGAEQDSTLRLFEDGRPLGPPHTLHLDLGALGGGRYSHWNGTIYFTATDNSDPRANGRSYTYSDRARLHFGFLLVGVLLLAGSLWLGRKGVTTAARYLAQRPRLRIDTSVATGAAILLAAIALSWLFQLILAARQDVSHDDIATLTGYCAVVIAGQGLVVWIVRRGIALLFTLFSVANTFSLHFVFSGDLIQYPVYLQLALLLSLGVLYFVVFRLLEQRGAWRAWVLAGAVLCTTGLGIAALEPFIPESRLAEHAKPEFREMRAVKFQRRPNVYFLGFDAMTPGSLADKLLRIGHPPYVDVVKKHGGHILRNMFADRIWTTYFWGTTMNILPPHNPQEAALGIEPSILLATFLNNGYDTHFSFWTPYIGPDKGPFLTTYAVAYPYTTCDFLGELPKRYGFLGYCAFRSTVSRLSKDAQEDVSLDDFYVERLRTAIRAGASKPQFFAAHYPLPGHTSLEYRNGAQEFAAFQTEYRKTSAAAAIMLDKMLTEIRASDPAGIVFVFGDHGSGISRGIDYVDNPEFVVQDRHGIFGAVFGAPTCMPYLEPPGGRFQTSSRAVAGLLQCLAGGVSPLLIEYDFGRIDQAPNKMRFEDYAYE